MNLCYNKVLQLYAYGYFSFCLTSCNLGILKNKIKFFSRETSFCQLTNMASSGLKKMFILIILYTHGGVSVNICLKIFFLLLMADVMPYYALADVIASYVVVDGKPHGQMLLPIFYPMADVKTILKKIQPPKSNITREERKALAELRKDKNRIILTADKGVSMVVMDREEYTRKAEELLDQPAYKPIPTDPTTKYKNKLISLLKTSKPEGGINDVIYRRLYPTGADSKFYGLPEVHKEGMPLRPIVSSIGAVTYETSKELSRILKPLAGKSPYQVQNNQEFLQHLEGIQLGPDEMSYDVKALFTSVPIQPALNIIEKLLEEDPELQQRTHDSEAHHLSSGVLPEYIFYLPE